MIVTVVPQPDILQIIKVFRLAADPGKEDDDNIMADDEGSVKPGEYCVDSEGRFWRGDPDLTAILAAIDFDNNQLKMERIAARKRSRKAKKRGRRVK